MPHRGICLIRRLCRDRDLFILHASRELEAGEPDLPRPSAALIGGVLAAFAGDRVIRSDRWSE